MQHSNESMPRARAIGISLGLPVGLMIGFGLGLAGCGSGSNAPNEAPLDTDYSDLKLAESREVGLVPASHPDTILNALRNGIRLSVSGSAPEVIAGVTAPNATSDEAYSGTTVQVDGVDEADLVKYDGRHIYSVRSEPVPAKPGLMRHVLQIAKTNPEDATVEVTATVQMSGEHTSMPVIYPVSGDDGADYIAAISQNFQGWLEPFVPGPLVIQPDRTRVQLFDVRDPYNVSQAWEIELDGWMRATRKIGDVLYLVNSYRPRLVGLTYPADTQEKKEANERRIGNAKAQDLLPKVSINGGVAQQVATAGDCVIAADLRTEEAYNDLIVVTSIDLRTRSVLDAACMSTNVSGVFVSKDSLYIGGQGEFEPPVGWSLTVLHKFALDAGAIEYRATGGVVGSLPWNSASYFMDEHDDRLRVVTSEPSISGNPIHRLSILEEAPDHALKPIAILPSPAHPQPIGKPGDQVHAVRFLGDRAYVVTARTIDPLYVIDLADPFQPFIAGELEIPGVSTHLSPLQSGDRAVLLSIGRQLDQQGIAQGLKVELFDVEDIEQPRSLGAHVFGGIGSSSEAIDDPHALTLLEVPGGEPTHRVALPIDVHETSGPFDPISRWLYSGFHLLEVSAAQGEPQLKWHGVLKTAEPSGPNVPRPYVTPRRAILHADAVFGVNGGEYITSLWDAVPAP